MEIKKTKKADKRKRRADINKKLEERKNGMLEI